MKRTTRNSIAALSIIALLAFASAASATEPDVSQDAAKKALATTQTDQTREVVEEQIEIVADQVREDRSTPEFIQEN